MESIALTLPDGSVRETPIGSTALDVALSIGPGLAKAAIGAELDLGERVDAVDRDEIGGQRCLAVAGADDEVGAAGDRASPGRHRSDGFVDGRGDGEAHDALPSLVIQTRSAVIGS